MQADFYEKLAPEILILLKLCLVKSKPLNHFDSILNFFSQLICYYLI